MEEVQKKKKKKQIERQNHEQDRDEWVGII